MAETLAYKLPQRASRVKLAFAISYRTFPGWSRFAACRFVMPKYLACVSASTALVCSLRRETYVSDRRTRSATKTACAVAMDYHQVARQRATGDQDLKDLPQSRRKLKMRLPEFAAASSLYRTRLHYQMTAAAGHGSGIVP